MFTLTDKHLHIVCLDIPYPVDYGGAFDPFYKIKALCESGVDIHLHCFEKRRSRQTELNKYCSSVNYYKRKSIYQSFPFRLPYIVSSRAEPSLIHNLCKDDYPVLLEGIHCTYFLFTGDLENKKVLVRLHNVEYEYYEELANTTKNFFRKLYFQNESRLLKKYELKIANKALFLAVSKKDEDTYEQALLANRVDYLPVFLPFTGVKAETGSGDFCLYHGNLSVPENEKTALWLLENVFDTLDIPFVITGKNPSNHLKSFAKGNENVCLVADPSGNEMDDLVRKAHIHLLPSFNKTGVKIKLLNALFNGRFVVTNPAAAEGSGFEDLCKIAGNPFEYKKAITELFKIPFTDFEIAERKKILEGIYNNRENAKRLMRRIW